MVGHPVPFSTNPPPFFPHFFPLGRSLLPRGFPPSCFIENVFSPLPPTGTPAEEQSLVAFRPDLCPLPSPPPLGFFSFPSGTLPSLTSFFPHGARHTPPAKHPRRSSRSLPLFSVGLDLKSVSFLIGVFMACDEFARQGHRLRFKDSLFSGWPPHGLNSFFLVEVGLRSASHQQSPHRGPDMWPPFSASVANSHPSPWFGPPVQVSCSPLLSLALQPPHANRWSKGVICPSPPPFFIKDLFWVEATFFFFPFFAPKWSFYYCRS